MEQTSEPIVVDRSISTDHQSNLNDVLAANLTSTLMTTEHLLAALREMDGAQADASRAVEIAMADPTFVAELNQEPEAFAPSDVDAVFTQMGSSHERMADAAFSDSEFVAELRPQPEVLNPVAVDVLMEEQEQPQAYQPTAEQWEHMREY